MLGKYQAVFRNRWRAVIWSAGVLLTAYCTVPSADPEGSPEELEAARDATSDLLGQTTEPPAEHGHVNPWALQQQGPR